MICSYLRQRNPSPEKASDPGDGPPSYYCLKTLDGRGPDGQIAHPDHCTEARTCFEAPEEDSPDA